MEQEIKEGDKAKFYDCDQANKDKDYSGKNKKHYPVGIVKRVYEKENMFGGTDKLCDIELPDGRVSKSHFVKGVNKIN